jgi:hypothetical protein
LTRRGLLQTAAGIALWDPHSSAASNPWLAGTFRELHIDAHFAQLPAPYEDFDADRAADILKTAGFQMVSIFAVCNGGYSYYPTKLGVTHPGLKRDFTGEFSSALKRRGIRVLAYVSVGADRRHGNEHPEWMRAPSQGRGDVAQMCTSSPWVEEVHIPQLREIVSLYDVDGFFFDAVLGKFVRGVCRCRYCREAFGAEIPSADDDPKVFEHYRFLSRRGARYADQVVGAMKPGLAYVMNHVWVTHNPVRPPATLTQLVWEPVPPYTGVLSLDFSLQARYLATQRGVENWSCMTTRGNGWGDYSLRDPETFRHEAAVLLASGGRPYFGDDSYPSGNPDPAVYEVYGEVNRRTVALEPHVRGCVPVRDTAVLLSADSLWSGLPLNPPREWMGNPSSPGVAGAHKMLVEEHAQFGILNSETLVETLSDYRALILPEQRILNGTECEAIRRFVEAGGALIATGDTGTRDEANQPLDNFALADVLGVRFAGRADTRRAYLRARLEGIPRMDVQVNGAYSRIQTTTTKSLLDLVPPAVRQAPAEAAQGPGITLNRFGKGVAIYCAVPLFGAYHQDDTPVLRKLASWMFAQAHPAAERAIVLERAPLSAEVVLNARGQDRFVHLLNFGADRRLGGAPKLQDFSTVEGIQVRLRSKSRPSRVLLVPEARPIAFEWSGGWTKFQAQPLTVHGAYWIQA